MVNVEKANIVVEKEMSPTIQTTTGDGTAFFYNEVPRDSPQVYL